MRAKEYIHQHADTLRYPDEIRRLIAEFIKLRSDKQKTVDCYNRTLIADIRLQANLLAKDLYERNNAMQTDKPEPFQLRDGEIPVEIASGVRDALFEVISEDKTFGYLYFLLGNLRNSQRPTNPIDCVPDETEITEALKKSRDDYPKTDLAEYLDDDINYSQYGILTTTGITDEAELLDWFNNAYRIFDEIRLIKANPITAVRYYHNDTSCPTETAKTLTYRFIATLIDALNSKDKRLVRIKDELLKVLPQERTTQDAEEDKIQGSNKIRTVVICELLGKIGKGKNFNDLSKICNLAAYLTGGSPRKIYNEAQRGIMFSDYHKKELTEVNKILSDLSLDIQIKKDKEY